MSTFAKVVVGVVAVVLAVGIWLGVKSKNDDKLGASPSPTVSASASPVGSAGETPDEERDGK